jgi:hypothetical protein
MYGGFRLSREAVMAPLSPTPAMRKLTDAVHRDAGGEPHRLILSDSGIAAAKYGALTGEPVIQVPALASGTFADFAREWHVTHVYDGQLERRVWEENQTSHPDLMRQIRVSGVTLIPLDLPGLYRISLPPPAPQP